MRYPIGVQTFETIREDGYVYVDKTEIIHSLVQEHICFLSRPRRFGKSLLISTLEAYFLGKRELFNGLAMERLENDWDIYPVFRIDFVNGNFNDEHELINTLERYLSDWEVIYGKNDRRITLGDRFQYVLEQAYKITGKKAVVLIDEYDKPLLDPQDESLKRENRDILRAFYGGFKSADACLRFVLLTGVTKFSQITIFSGFNQVNDITLDKRYDALCGITEEELYEYFSESISEMANEMGYTQDKMKAVLKKQYDGYHFSSKMRDIYNPFSLLNAFDRMEIANYWYRTGTPTYLARLIDGHNINMQKLIGRPYESQYFMDYRADLGDPLALFYQCGYLTIKGYDMRYREYLLDFPNDEVKQGFLKLIEEGIFDIRM